MSLINLLISLLSRTFLVVSFGISFAALNYAKIVCLMNGDTAGIASFFLVMLLLLYPLGCLAIFAYEKNFLSKYLNIGAMAGCLSAILAASVFTFNQLVVIQNENMLTFSFPYLQFFVINFLILCAFFAVARKVANRIAITG